MPAPALGRVAHSLGTETVRVRHSQGTLVDGRWESTSDNDELIEVAPRPVSPSDRRLLPEGVRVSDSLTLLTRRPLTIESTSAGGAADPDRVLYDGWWWRVVGEKSWRPNGFYRYVAVRETPGSESNR